MCGFAGILGRLDEANRHALRTMTRALAHRGPDGEGTWESQDDGRGRGLLLGHRRLSILDLTPAGAQPMVDEETGAALAYNGEIYNFAELRAGLAGRGVRVRSSGDTEVLLRALRLSVSEAVRSARGMFAFAYWDGRARTLTLARDPLGIKPLYVARNVDPEGAWSVAFASELRALLASGLLRSPRLDPVAVGSVVWNGFVVGPHTAVRGVESVDPGELRVYDASGSSPGPGSSWELPAPAAAATTEAEVAEALEESVRLHLVSDVPLAVFLSGGVDSSAVANVAQRAARGRVHTFTLAFEEPELDEGPVARRIAESIGTEHTEVVLNQRDFLEGLETALDSLDQPTFDGLNSYFMARAVRRAGFKVALVGTGGDELFGGYTSFRDLPVLRYWGARLGRVPQLARVAAARGVALAMLRSRGTIPPQTRWAKLPDMIARGDDLLALYQLAYALFLPEFQRELLAGDVAASIEDGLPDAMRRRLARETRGRSALAAISVLEQRLFLGERLLRDSDAASMAASLELRLPLVDRVLLERVFGLADGPRYAPVGRKALLRKVGLRGIDPRLFTGAKRGFVLPYDRWIRAELGGEVDQVLRDTEALAAVGLRPEGVQRLWRAFRDGSPGVYWTRVWTLYVLARWCARNGVYL
jgi:asparagine synthase (glutamine-hydrolysing)